MRKFCCASLSPFYGDRVSEAFHLICAYIIFGSVSVAEWPTFGKQLLTCQWLTLCSLCLFFLLIVILVISHFGFEGWILVLSASVPDICILFTFISNTPFWNDSAAHFVSSTNCSNVRARLLSHNINICGIQM